MREIVRNLKQSTFAIANATGKVVGTCFVVDIDNYILTAHHVVHAPGGTAYNDFTILDQIRIKSCRRFH